MTRVAVLTAGAALTLLAACGGGAVEGTAPDVTGSASTRERLEQSGTSGSLLDLAGATGGGISVSGGERSQGLAGSVNRHLWAASLDTLSFLPIASTDPFTGVIATDWGAAPDAPGERFKVTAYVTDVVLDPAALRVAVFREVLNDGGAWVPAEVAQETPRKIEDSILVRARQLRLAERTRG